LDTLRQQQNELKSQIDNMLQIHQQIAPSVQEVTNLLSEQRKKEIEELLTTKFKIYSVEQLKRMIWSCSSELDDELIHLFKLVPSITEVDYIFRTLREQDKLNSSVSALRSECSLCQVDNFLLTLLSGNCKRGEIVEEDHKFSKLYRSIVESWIFRTQFDTMNRDILIQLNHLTKACRELERSEALLKFLGVVLVSNNLVEVESESEHTSFKLSSLGMLKDSIGVESELSIVKYVTQFCSKRYPDVNILSLEKELNHVTLASRIDVDKIGEQLISNRKKFAVLKELSTFCSEHASSPVLDEQLCQRICSEKIIQSMGHDIQEMSKRFMSTMKRLQQTAMVYNEKIEKMSDYSRMFGYVTDFLESFAKMQDKVNPKPASKRSSLRLPSTSKVLTEDLLNSSSASASDNDSSIAGHSSSSSIEADFEQLDPDYDTLDEESDSSKCKMM